MKKKKLNQDQNEFFEKELTESTEDEEDLIDSNTDVHEEYITNHFITKAVQRSARQEIIKNAVRNPDNIYFNDMIGTCNYEKGNFIVCTKGGIYRTIKRKKNKKGIVPKDKHVEVDDNGTFTIR